MDKEELIEHSVFKLNKNEIYSEYLIPSEHSPLEVKDICGCWLFVFESKKLMTKWIHLHETLIKVVNSNIALKKVVTFEAVHKLDENTLCQNRGFNEAYTTEHYFEFLTDGDCKPNELIIQHLDELKQALDQPYEFKLESESQQKIINELIERAFVKPNLELKWTNEPHPWTLYSPLILRKDLSEWNIE